MDTVKVYPSERVFGLCSLSPSVLQRYYYYLSSFLAACLYLYKDWAIMSLFCPQYKTDSAAEGKCVFVTLCVYLVCVCVCVVYPHYIECVWDQGPALILYSSITTGWWKPPVFTLPVTVFTSFSFQRLGGCRYHCKWLHIIDNTLFWHYSQLLWNAHVTSLFLVCKCMPRKHKHEYGSATQSSL